MTMTVEIWVRPFDISRPPCDREVSYYAFWDGHLAECPGGCKHAVSGARNLHWAKVEAIVAHQQRKGCQS